MEKIRLQSPFRPVYPSPAGLIASGGGDTMPNIMTAGEIFNVSLRTPVVVGISIRKATYTHSLIRASGEFTLNFPTVSILEKVDLIGSISGRGGFDKFAAYGLTPLPSDIVATPIIAECPVNLECKLWSFTEVGDHDMFLGEVVAMHVDADKLDAEQEICSDKLDAFAYGMWDYFRIGENLGRHGFSRQKPE